MFHHVYSVGCLITAAPLLLYFPYLILLFFLDRAKKITVFGIGDESYYLIGLPLFSLVFCTATALGITLINIAFGG
jgi:hypothetical protein